MSPEPETRGPRSQRLVLGNAMAGVGAGILAVLVAIAVFAPVLAPYDPTERVGAPFAPPSSTHLLGTNDVGQDLLSELIFGARVTLAVGVAAAVAATVIGTIVGLLGGYLRGWVDTVLMRFTDVVLALPFLPLVIVIGVFLGPGLTTQIAVIGGVIWAGTARELRSQVLSTRELQHVEAARSMGAGPVRVLRRHVLPVVAPLVVPQFVLATKTAILAEASLAFLGLGDIGAKSWGTTLFFAHQRSAFLTDAWRWWVVPPGIAIMVTILGFALVGYAIENRSLTTVAPRAGRRRPTRSSVGVEGSIAAAQHPDGAVLVVENLSVAYGTGAEAVVAVDGLSMRIDRGEVVGVIGESGSGKSTLVAAATRLLRPPAAITGGRVLLAGTDLAELDEEEMRSQRGTTVALVPQQAMHAMNPVQRIGDQIREAITVHHHIAEAGLDRRIDELLSSVGIEPGRASAYPHEFSGGMRQRAVIAMALANDPALLIADEPTTGLDVVVQAEILDLLHGLTRRLGVSMLVVTHDLPVACRLADRLIVMQSGRVVEEGIPSEVISQPRHPHTHDLIAGTLGLRTSRPELKPAAPAPAGTP